MKQNILFFKSFFASFLLLYGSNMQISAAEHNDSVAKDPMDDIEVSLLTCQPHDEVYSLYGHTAIRVRDKRSGQDWAVNWGVFDTRSKNFVLRFIFGLTDYMMGIYNFQDFLQEYDYYGSDVYQQRINMTSNEKRTFMALLEENSRPENSTYRYNYFYNNCTTRARDIILMSMDGDIKYAPSVFHQERYSFRQLIHSKNEDHRWARFGNDLLLGTGSDFNTNQSERQFLPEILQNDFDSASILYANGITKPLVDTAFVVLQSNNTFISSDPSPPFTPFQAAIFFLCVIMSVIFYGRVKGKDTSWMVFAGTLPYGLAGIIITAMIFSQHPTVSLNLQILILNPIIPVLSFPRLRMKYRWHIILILCLCFFIGNAIQSYAEGMNIMALALSMMSASMLYNAKTS